MFSQIRWDALFLPSSLSRLIDDSEQNETYNWTCNWQGQINHIIQGLYVNAGDLCEAELWNTTEVWGEKVESILIGFWKMEKGLLTGNDCGLLMSRTTMFVIGSLLLIVIIMRVDTRRFYLSLQNCITTSLHFQEHIPDPDLSLCSANTFIYTLVTH